MISAKKKYTDVTLLVLILSCAVTLGMISAKSRMDERGEVFIHGGVYGADKTEMPSFVMDKNLVTVADFATFVDSTGYITDAERYGNAGVFDEALASFIAVEGAYFKFPFGRNREQAKADHPVTQVSWHDAVAYAKWKGKRLPTKAEWEYAASSRYKTTGQYAWGNDLLENGKFKANTWQGSFPFTNTADDGYAYTSPVGAFGANPLGLTDMGGNVWQWCSDSIEPPPHERILDPSMRRILKGGSYLCDPMVCHGYQIQGESNSTPESSMAHIGFRCVRDVK
jgi:formylglycine-generating enzyme